MKKRVLITGASRGIGKAIAIKLAGAGYAVVINYRSQQAVAEQTMAGIRQDGGEAALLPFEVQDTEAARIAIETDIKANGLYWGVVCNAGITKDAPFPFLEAEDWKTVIDTNLNSFYNVLHPVVKPMVRQKNGGRIITMSSVSGLTGNRGQTNYSASKAGIIGATRSLSTELARRRITVNCIAPGLIETDMAQDLPKEEIIKMIPMRRFGRPEEVASLAHYLLSDDASYISGQVISVNGGML